MKKTLLGTDCFDHITNEFYHVIVSFCLLSYLGQIDGFLNIPDHLLLFKMTCNCQEQWCKVELLRREKTIKLLKEMNQQQIELHERKIRELSHTIQQYTKEKDRECEGYVIQIQGLRQKVDHYKLKCCKLNQKIKQNTNLVRDLMENKLTLQNQIVRCREDLDKEKQKQVEASRYRSQMKQIISLQQIENNELVKQCSHLKQEIEYLKKQIAGFGEIRDKFINVETISDDQYKNELTLLKGKLEHQFCKSTNEILNEISWNELNETTDHIRKRNEKKQIKPDSFSKINQEHEQLQKISNYIDYGHHYFLLDNDELKLPQSIKIFAFISSILQQRLELEKQLAQQRETTISISNELKEQILSLQDQYKDMTRKTFTNEQTQTADYSKITDVINMNSQLKLKIYEMHKIIVLFSHFATYTLNFLKVHHQKQDYYHFTQKIFFRQIVKKQKNIFKKTAIAVLFIEILNKKSRKIKRINIQPILSRESIKNYISNQPLQRYFYDFFLSLKRNNTIKNYKIEQILKQKFQFSSQIKLIQIIHQEILNQGKNGRQFDGIFHRFQFQIEHRIAQSQ